MSMLDEAAGLPSVTDSMVQKPEATCGRCGADIFHPPCYVDVRVGSDRHERFVMTVCHACYPTAVREAAIGESFTNAAVIDDAAGRIRGHLAEVEAILMGTPSPGDLMMPAQAQDDYAMLCHAFRLLLYIAKRFHVTSIVETDVAAGGTGHGDAPRKARL